MLFTSFLARSVMTGGVHATARELNLVDPDEGTDLLFEVLTHPLPESGPNSGRVLSVLRNVTDLRRAAHELERQVQRGRLAEMDATRERDRLNLILENVADPILVTDDRSGIILMNDQAERLFAIGEEEPIGSARQVPVRDNDTKFTSFISDFTIDKSQALRAQMRLTHPDTNVEVPMEVVSGKIRNERGETMAIVSVLHDLTKQAENERLYEALKQLNSELERRVAAATADLAAQNARLQWQSQEVEKANKLKSDFLASMSHELRTPINALLGYTSLMLDRIYGELTTGQEDGLNRIRASARHLLELISDILDLARIEAGKMPIHLSEFAVSDVLGEVARQIEPMIRKKALTFESIAVGEPPVIYTDGVKVRQILLNLLSNAVKFTPSGRVTLTTLVRGEHVAFEVADTGIGIRLQDLAFDLGGLPSAGSVPDTRIRRDWPGSQHHTPARRTAGRRDQRAQRIRRRHDVHGDTALPGCAWPGYRGGHQFGRVPGHQRRLEATGRWDPVATGLRVPGRGLAAGSRCVINSVGHPCRRPSPRVRRGSRRRCLAGPARA